MSAPEHEALRQAVVGSEAMAQHLRRLAASLQGIAPEAEDDLATERRHAFLRMFEQLYDVTARRLFRGALLLAREDHRSLSYKAVVRRIETLGILADGDTWLNAGDARNILVHDYAASPQLFADHVALAFAHLDTLLDTHAEVTGHLRAEGLFT